MDTQHFIESRVIVDRRDLNVFGQTISSSPLHGGWGGGMQPGNSIQKEEADRHVASS